MNLKIFNKKTFQITQDNTKNWIIQDKKKQKATTYVRCNIITMIIVIQCICVYMCVSQFPGLPPHNYRNDKNFARMQDTQSIE